MDTNISLIIPVHNAEPFLERCLNSAVAQKAPQLEIICINDASTDASRDILDAYASRDRRFRIVHREVNGGESAARNHGLSLARGEYLAFLDHDDMLEPDALRVLNEAAQASGSDIVRGRVKTVDYEGTSSLSPLQLHADICTRSRFYFHVDWWSAIYRASLVQGKLSFAEEYPIGGDMLFLTEALLATSRVTCVDDLVYTHFLSPESGASRVFSPEKVCSTIAAYSRIINLLHQHNIDTSDYIGYSHKFVSLFDNVVHLLAARCSDAQSRLACCDFLFTIKNMHRYPADLLDSLQKSSAYLKPLLASGEPEGLRSIIKGYQDLDAKAFAAVFFPSVFRHTISKELSSKHPKKCKNNPHFPSSPSSAL